MSHPKNSITPTSAQEQKLFGLENALLNSSKDMAEAGDFIWALGTLLREIYSVEKEDELLPPSVASGLVAGLQIIGAKLSDDGEAVRTLLSRSGACAQGGNQ